LNSSRESQLIYGRIFKAIFLGVVLMALLGTKAQAVERSSHVKLIGTTIVQLAKRNIPAAVYIVGAQRQAVHNLLLAFKNGPFFRYTLSGTSLNFPGEVINVNAGVGPQSGVLEGIDLAIPSNMAVYIARQLIVHDKIKYGWLGVSVQDLTPDLAKHFGLENSKGALISDVFRGGPADKAGIKRGAVIINYLGKKIPDASALRNEVSVTPVGKIVGITLWRNGKKQEVLVRIGNLKTLSECRYRLLMRTSVWISGLSRPERLKNMD